MLDLNPQVRHIDEQSLVKQAVDGNLDAYNQLVLVYQNMAYNHAYALLSDHAVAEDVTQESLIKAFQALKFFRGDSFRAWLLRIVTNTAYDLLRRSRRHPTTPLIPQDENGEEIESATWLADQAASVPDIVEQNELTKHVFRLIEELPEVYRTVLTLIDMYELDYAEVARALNVPLGTVKSRLARARLRMSEKLRSVKNTPFCLYCPA